MMNDTITMPRDEFVAYQRAVESAKDEIARLYRERNHAITALKAIDRHIVGACESAFGMPEPCEECGEMREIAAQALKAIEGGA